MLEEFEKLLGNVFSEEFVEKLKENLKTSSEYWSARYEDGKKVSETHEKWENGKLVAGNSSADINGCYVGCDYGDEVNSKTDFNVVEVELDNKKENETETVDEVEARYLAKLELIDKEVDKLTKAYRQEYERRIELERSFQELTKRYETLVQKFEDVKKVLL